MKTAIITGGSQGIGAMLVEMFIENGYSVVFSARNENDFVKKIGEKARFVKADATVKAGHQKLVDVALEWTGQLDVYINNVGLSWWRPLVEIDEDFLNNMISTNLSSVFWGSQAAARAMKNGGSIINISSLAGKRGSANNSAYCASKFGVNGLTQSIAKELGGQQIRVNAVCPVYIKTDNLIDALKSDQSPTGGEDIGQYFDNFTNGQTALKRLPLAKEVAQSCLFLAGDQASAITGQCINVDCGVMPQ